MKIALIAFGNEESYGLLFVGGELLRFGQKIRFFDTEKENPEKEIVDWQPDFIFFSPIIFIKIKISFIFTWYFCYKLLFKDFSNKIQQI